MLIKKITLKIIKLYQRTISPDHGIIFRHRYPYGYCRFKPTCSQYSYQAIKKYGVIKGSWKGIGRILRCNPWNHGGYDPLK